nr:hypothetical protein BaRGS_003391 [Batillaria attramentaria]
MSTVAGTGIASAFAGAPVAIVVMTLFKLFNKVAFPTDDDIGSLEDSFEQGLENQPVAESASSTSVPMSKKKKDVNYSSSAAVLSSAPSSQIETDLSSDHFRHVTRGPEMTSSEGRSVCRELESRTTLSSDRDHFRHVTRAPEMTSSEGCNIQRNVVGVVHNRRLDVGTLQLLQHVAVGAKCWRQSIERLLFARVRHLTYAQLIAEIEVNANKSAAELEQEANFNKSAEEATEEAAADSSSGAVGAGDATAGEDKPETQESKVGEASATGEMSKTPEATKQEEEEGVGITEIIQQYLTAHCRLPKIEARNLLIVIPWTLTVLLALFLSYSTLMSASKTSPEASFTWVTAFGFSWLANAVFVFPVLVMVRSVIFVSSGQHIDILRESKLKLRATRPDYVCVADEKNDIILLKELKEVEKKRGKLPPRLRYPFPISKKRLKSMMQKLAQETTARWVVHETLITLLFVIFAMFVSSGHENTTRVYYSNKYIQNLMLGDASGFVCVCV